ncbi:polyprenyl diphosphate synthase [Campylobacter sp. MIT 97-5078]|uniref:polyprenyl diphosphate synthase n=1 Tax=Campylobacter sp. MIT 97-5078 TaxID=1548153 RepID=UPI000512B4D9|nr:polyprenyl diphosphate synthase [Campylobacter sp. MIT 97-5078]KGI55989.1 UDP pyrophosphate synthase [Campylobacter sp. MIT 97-5078]KGI57451.1 UDP pyrophosphate synthase [Campylobacter sp. MIT 97-5078]KGI57521.1 UDP pyrophosphate synthase [Campylobacter sp. MIT 97-5078]TQR27375.1 di-trans,poly-cis-decaprenylcistransferase [Campylobacter sp. MIT 97-5078]
MNTLNHLAVVMDGNRRWARQNGFLAKLGYSRGLKTIERLMQVCVEEGIKELSLFAFSTENWARPKDEIEFIFNLLEKVLDESIERFIQNNVRLRTIGDLSRLEPHLQAKIKRAEELTANCTLLCVNLAISYGSKDEIVRAVKRCIEKGLEPNEANISANLDLALDVDLLLRVGDAKRLSNFLLWQCAYAEICFSNTLFPGLTKREFKKNIKEFQKRERTFGK